MSNKTGIGWRFKALTEVNDYSKPNWIWFGIFMRLTMVINFFQTNLNLVWNLRLAKFHFFFPNQTGIGLENPTHFLGVSFPNQTGFGLEKDTEWNLAALWGPQPMLLKFINFDLFQMALSDFSDVVFCFWFQLCAFFSCPGQLNKWQCRSVGLSEPTNNQSLGSIKEWP